MQDIDIKKLREIVVQELSNYNGNQPIKLPLEPILLNDLIFEDKKISKELESVLPKIDFSEVNFDGFYALKFDFSSYKGVKINPQTINCLAYAICDGVEFIGSFDHVNISGTNFKGSKGAKINPQTIYLKNLTGAICSDVEFVGTFDNVYMIKTNFEGSKGAKIDPQTIHNKDMSETICSDVEFIGTFDDVNISGTNFKGSKGAKIDPQTIHNKNLSGAICSDVEFIGTFDDVNTLKTNFKGSNHQPKLSFEEEFEQKIKKLVLENNNN